MAPLKNILFLTFQCLLSTQLIFGQGQKCVDKVPIGAAFSCEQQRNWGKCNEAWMEGFCECTCAKTSPASSGIIKSTSATARCTDIPPPGGNSCADQVQWGKCGQPWMSGYCQCSCAAQTISESAIISEAATTNTNGVGEGIGGDFVQRSGTRFVIKSPSDPSSCETFYFVGWNTYYLMIKAADPKTRKEVTEVLDDAVDMGMTVVRTWAFSDGPLQWQGLQRTPGQFDEATFVGMDYVLHEASKRGIKVVMALTNYWQHFGGIDQYNIWSYQAGVGNCNGEYLCRDDFYRDGTATSFYKDYVAAILNRRNTFNGLLYKEDPTIFGYNLMNEPRSKADLYVVTRESFDETIGEYNITYNDGSALQEWIDDVAKFIKDIDPVHLLTTGQEGFFGESAPLYLYANPGAWAQLEGNDFVRNHQSKYIDYATIHIYVDQWLCTVEGSTREGQMKFFREWLEGHQAAAEEELQMPLVLEEFGGKLADNKRKDLFEFAFARQLESARRGGSFGGVMFWILYHNDYYPMDNFGGGYGMYLPAQSEAMKVVEDMVRDHSWQLKSINERSINQGTCVWYPPWPRGLGCRALDIDFELGGMPWECLPGEPENLNWCNGRGRFDLYQNPPNEWRGRKDGSDLPFNTVEALIMGRIRNRSNKPVNLRDSYIVIPFSRGIHTIFEGVWDRVEQPNIRFSVFCWYMAIFESNGISKTGASLCNGETFGITFRFTEFGWPTGVKRDRGLKLSFNGDIVLNPGAFIAADSVGRGVMFSFKDEFLSNRLDVSSLALAGASDCPQAPRLTSWPPPPPPPPPPCWEGKHPYRGCPDLNWYKRGQEVKYLAIESIPTPCEFENCGPNTYNPYNDRPLLSADTVSSFSGGDLPGDTLSERPIIGVEDFTDTVVEAIIAPVLNITGDQTEEGKSLVQEEPVKPVLVSGISEMEKLQTDEERFAVIAQTTGKGVTAGDIMRNPSALVAGSRALERLIPGISTIVGFGQNRTSTCNESIVAITPASERVLDDVVAAKSDGVVLFINTTALLNSPQGENGEYEESGRRRHLLWSVEDFTSISNSYEGLLKSGDLRLVTAEVWAMGAYRKSGQQQVSSRDDQEVDLSSTAAGLSVREDEPESVSAEDIGPTAADTPNPEERGAANRGGLIVRLVAEMTIKDLAGKKYRTIAKGVVKPNGPRETIRGIIEVDGSATDVKIYAEVAVKGLTVTLGQPNIIFPTSLPAKDADLYTPCVVDPDRSPDAVFIFTAEANEEWQVDMCSRGYGQNLRVFENGEQIPLIGSGFEVWSVPDLQVEKGVTYYFVLDGSDHGQPYGSWRGGSGIHIKRKNGKPFAGKYDAAPNRGDDFVYVMDGKFWKGCKQFSYVGVNTWDLMDLARYPTLRIEVDNRLDELQKIGLTVGRTWGFSLGTGTTKEERENRLQLTPGVYDEAVFEGLDYALDAAAKRGIKLIVSIEDFWLSVGAYEDWSDTMQSKTDFYSDWKARNFYKEHLYNIVHRVNVFNGRKYLNDPTIFAWNLMNEPRCTGCGWALQAWIEEMAVHMKAIDPNHLVTIGEEGFYSSTCDRVHINPGAGTRRTGIGSSPWALQEGQDFINNHRPDAIDFATVHIWADNWMGYADYCGFLFQNKRFDYTYGCDLWKEKLDYTKKWLIAHIIDSGKLGKPLIVEEFGKTIEASKLYDEIEDALMPGETSHQGLEIRNEVFKAVYQEIENDIKKGGSTFGSNFWNLYTVGQGQDDPYHVTLAQTSTIQIVKDHIWNLRNLASESRC